MQLLQIEQELSGPDAQKNMEMYDGQLLALEARVKRALDAGLPLDEFNRCNALAEVIVVARKLLRLQVKKAMGN